MSLSLVDILAPAVEKAVGAEDPMQAFAEALDLKGGGTWSPVRAADFDAAAWGRWETWEHCTIGELPSGAVGAIRSGDWVAWDSASGFHLGFPSREKAEMMAVLQNEGAPTRVVLADGSFVASTVDFDVLLSRVQPEFERLEREYEQVSRGELS